MTCARVGSFRSAQGVFARAKGDDHVFLPSTSLSSASISLSNCAAGGLPTHCLRMTPLASIKYSVGQPLTLQALEIGPCVPPAPFQNERQVICSLASLRLRAARSRSLLTPMSANGLLSSFLTSDRSCGYMARQGPHQCPQKSRSTTLPR